jgi:hypothetical protein
MQKYKGPFQISGMGEPRPVEGSAGLRSTVPHRGFLEDPELNYLPAIFLINGIRIHPSIRTCV